MAKMILKKFASQREWDKHWKDRLKLEGRVMLSFGLFNPTSRGLSKGSSA
jgi:hypothetical protein